MTPQDRGQGEDNRFISGVSQSLDDSLLEVLMEHMNVSGIVSERRNRLEPEDLAWQCGVGLETARRTLKVTMQKGDLHSVVSFHFQKIQDQ